MSNSWAVSVAIVSSYVVLGLISIFIMMLCSRIEGKSPEIVYRSDEAKYTYVSMMLIGPVAFVWALTKLLCRFVMSVMIAGVETIIARKYKVDDKNNT